MLIVVVVTTDPASCSAAIVSIADEVLDECRGGQVAPDDVGLWELVFLARAQPALAGLELQRAVLEAVDLVLRPGDVRPGACVWRPLDGHLDHNRILDEITPHVAPYPIWSCLRKRDGASSAPRRDAAAVLIEAELADHRLDLAPVFLVLALQRGGIDERDARRLVAEYIAEVLIPSRRYELGESVFAPWRCPRDKCLTRIKTEWDALGRDPDIGDIAWFSMLPQKHYFIAQMLRALRQRLGADAVVVVDPLDDSLTEIEIRGVGSGASTIRVAVDTDREGVYRISHEGDSVNSDLEGMVSLLGGDGRI
jgi:hypothetical protein